MLISQFLASLLSKGPQRIAIDYLGIQTTFGDFQAFVGRLSYLFQHEIGSNKRVAFIGSNSPAVISAFLALSNTRSVFIPISAEVSDDQIVQWVYDTFPTHVMVTSDVTSRIQDVFRRRGISLPVIEVEKKRGGEYSTSYIAPADNPPKDSDPILLLKSAGTAGKSKYALFNHLQVQAAVQGLKPIYKSTAADRFFTTMNFSHPFAWMHGFLYPILSGATCVIDPGMSAVEYLDYIHKSKINRIVDAPEFFQKLLLTCRSRKTPLHGVNSITTSFGALPSEYRKIFALMKIKVLNCYGQTENLWSLCMSNGEQAGDEMVPLSGFKYKALDASGESIEKKEAREGQLAVMSPAVMARYDHKDEKVWKDETQHALRGTWLYTGDIFKVEGEKDDLKLTFLKRKDGFKPRRQVDMYNPDLIQLAVTAQAGVESATVFQHNGLILCAVILKPDVSLTGHQIWIEAKSALTPKNTPKEIKVLPVLPLDAEGKLDMDRLLEFFGFEKPKSDAA